MLNILEPMRSVFGDYLAANPDLKLHKDFAHLNSSQAACINLFLPLLTGTLGAIQNPQGLLPFSAASIDSYQFEYVPNKIEGTNFDFWVRTKDSREYFFEFKLTESEFGRAKNDTPHQQKLNNIYIPMLAGKVDPAMLVPDRFFSHYQLLRNIAYVDSGLSASVVFLVPRANERLTKPLAEMDGWLSPATRPLVSVLYLEDIVSQMRQSTSSGMSAYFDAFAEKYLPDR